MNNFILFLEDIEQVSTELPEEAENLFKFICEKLHEILTTPLGQILGISALGGVTLWMIIYAIWIIFKKFILEGKTSKLLKLENEELRHENKTYKERLDKLESKDAQREADIRTIYKFNRDVGYYTHNSKLKEAAEFRYDPIVADAVITPVEQTTTYLVKRKRGKKHRKHHNRENRIQKVKEVVESAKEIAEEISKEV